MCIMSSNGDVLHQIDERLRRLEVLLDPEHAQKLWRARYEAESETRNEAGEAAMNSLRDWLHAAFSPETKYEAEIVDRVFHRLAFHWCNYWHTVNTEELAVAFAEGAKEFLRNDSSWHDWKFGPKGTHAFTELVKRFSELVSVGTERQ